MTRGNERTISFYFSYERYNAREHETTTVKTDGMLRLGMGVSFVDIQEFRDRFSKVYRKAVKMVLDGETWNEFRICVADYAWNHDAQDILDYHSEGFNSWEVVSAHEQGDPKESGFLYASPDTQYTDKRWDMLVYSDIFKTLAEASV